MSEDSYVTRTEAARMLGVSLRTVDRMVSDGRLVSSTGHYRIGQRGPTTRVLLRSIQGHKVS
jgi:excisionase family DNA binding protein